MGRKQRYDADYFPFFVKEGRTLTVIQKLYGLEGMGFFTNIMRMLTRTPYHHVQVKGEADELYFWTTIGTSKDRGEEMLKTLIITGKIDRELWENYRVIVSADLMDSLQPMYDKRTNPMMTIDEIRDKYSDDNRPEKKSTRGRNTQRREEKSKVDLSLRTEIFEIFYFKNFNRPHEELDKFVNHYDRTGWHDKNGNKVTNVIAAAKAWDQKNFKPNMPAKLLIKWQGVYQAMKEAFPNEAIKLLKYKPRKIENSNLHFQVPDQEAVSDIENEPMIVRSLSMAIREHFGDVKIQYEISNKIT